VTVELEQVADEVHAAVAYLVNSADHDMAAVATMHYRVSPTLRSDPNSNDDGKGAAGLRAMTLTEDGDHLTTVSSAMDVLEVLYRRVHQRAFELASLRGWVRLHAASVDDVSRVLLVGPSGTGKTTLSCRLRLDGVDVPADESVLVRGGIALPVARPFHIKPTMNRVLPRVHAAAELAPALVDGSVRALDPRVLGGSWRIVARPVAAIVLLHRRDDGTGGTPVPLTTIETMPRLVQECFPNLEPPATLLRELAGLLRVARCYEVSLSDLRGAADGVRSLAAGTIA